jgi:hypothetical protein
MICHQAIRIYLAIKRGLPLLEIVEIIEIVVVTRKHRLAIMAALDNMMRAVGKDESGLSRHGITLPYPAEEVKNNSVPIFFVD